MLTVVLPAHCRHAVSPPAYFIVLCEHFCAHNLRVVNGQQSMQAALGLRTGVRWLNPASVTGCSQQSASWASLTTSGRYDTRVDTHWALSRLDDLPDALDDLRAAVREVRGWPRKHPNSATSKYAEPESVEHSSLAILLANSIRRNVITLCPSNVSNYGHRNGRRLLARAERPGDSGPHPLTARHCWERLSEV